MGKIVTLGEIMLRLSTPGNTRFVQSDSFDVVYGGGEANVAVSCANYGHNAYFVTKLPKHEIGQSAVNVSGIRAAKAGGCVFAVVEHIRSGSVDGNSTGVGSRVGSLLAHVELKCFKFIVGHNFVSFRN